MWISDLPHFCCSGECEREGQYEVTVRHNENISANLQQDTWAMKPWEPGWNVRREPK